MNSKFTQDHVSAFFQPWNRLPALIKVLSQMLPPTKVLVAFLRSFLPGKTQTSYFPYGFKSAQESGHHQIVENSFYSTVNRLKPTVR